MAKIKYDVSGVDPEKALQNFAPPKPGVYLVKLAEINPGYSKGDDGKPNKSKPRLELVMQVQDKGEFKGSNLWDYISFSEEAKWKLFQFLHAIGEKEDPGAGTLDTDKYVGTNIKVRVVADPQRGKFGEEDYRPKVAMLMRSTAGGEAPGEEDSDPFAGGGEDDPFAGGGEDEVDPFGGGGDDDASVSTPDGGSDAPAAELDDGYDEMSVPDLRKECNSRGLDHKGAKPALIARLREDDNSEPF